MSDKPISDLRRRMIADMTVRTFSDKTQHDYIRQVEAFARFLGRSPDTATGDDIRRFQLAQVEQGAQPPKMNTQASALRFFLTITLGRAVIFVSISIGTLHLLESKDPAGPNPRIQITAMEATAIADLDAGGRDSFFDVAAERLLANGQIGSGAL